MKDITHSNMPEAIQMVLEQQNQIMSLFENFKNRGLPPEPSGDTMNLDELIKFLASEGKKMAKSTIYKRVSAGTLDYEKFNGKLTFSKEKIREWLRKETTSPDKIRNEAVKTLVKSAQKKERR